MKSRKTKILIAGGLATFILFIIGFMFISSLVIYATEETLMHRTAFISLWDPLLFRFYMGLLLALCLPIAVLLSRLVSKSEEPSIRLLSVLLFFLIPLVSAIIGMWLRLMEMKTVVDVPSTIAPDYTISLMSINYFSWGISSMLIVSIPAMYILSRRKRIK